MSSLSSCFMNHITCYRNPDGLENQWFSEGYHQHFPSREKVLVAEIGYLTVIPIAAMEATVSSIAQVAASCLPIEQSYQDRINNWASSSRFSVIWSVGDAYFNFVFLNLMTNENNARVWSGFPPLKNEQEVLPELHGWIKKMKGYRIFL